LYSFLGIQLVLAIVQLVGFVQGITIRYAAGIKFHPPYPD